MEIATLRRDFALLPQDENFLDDYGLPWETVLNGSQWVLIHDYPTHEGYNHKHVTVAVRLETGYPKSPLDMVYVYPHLVRVDRKPIPATQGRQQIENRLFQRWSRHRTAQNPWKPHQDSLGTHIMLIEDWFTREFDQ
ncbi:hypothetical protein MJD09_07055 [bacterium]|nr:hypothetical protein [bacterium]